MLVLRNQARKCDVRFDIAHIMSIVSMRRVEVKHSGGRVSTENISNLIPLTVLSGFGTGAASQRGGACRRVRGVGSEIDGIKEMNNVKLINN